MSEPVAPRRLLRVPEVADRLGVSTRTVERRIESGELRAVKLGSGRKAPVRVDELELTEFIYGPAAA